MPAWPLLSAPDELDAVALPTTEGSVFTKSATFAVPEVWISSAPSTLTGVGAS